MPPQLLGQSSKTSRSSTAASITDPVPRSAATNRRRTCVVDVRRPATLKVCRNQPPDVSGPAGPTVSTFVQVKPPSPETSTTNTSALGPPPASLLYQRQYPMCGSA